MTERFVFTPNPSLHEVERVLETPQGLAAVAQVRSDFASLAAVLIHTQSFGTDSSVIHLPDGSGITLVHLPKSEIAGAAKAIGATLGQGFF